MPHPHEVIDVDSFQPDIVYQGTKEARYEDLCEPIVISSDDELDVVISSSRTQQRAQTHKRPSFQAAACKRSVQVSISHPSSRGDSINTRKRLLTGRPDDRVQKLRRESGGPCTMSSTLAVSNATTPALHRNKRKRGDLRDSSGNDVQRTLIFRGATSSELSDSDDNYVNTVAGLDDTISNWKPLTRKVVDEPDELPPQDPPSSFQTSYTDEATKIRRRIVTRSSQESRECSNLPRGPFLWDMLRNSNVPAKYCPNRQVTTRAYSHRQTLRKDTFAHALKLSSSFRQAPGSINKISQSSGTIAICTAAVGGYPDNDEEEPNAYNFPGSLMVWRNGELKTLHSHKKERPRSDGGFFLKFYTVNDVILEPTCPTRMVTSGNDKAVRVWSYTPSGSLSVRPEATARFAQVPHDLAFKPGESILAVACGDSKVHVFPSSEMRGRITFPVAPPNLAHSTGSIVWGLEGSSDYLFASSEPPGKDDCSGFHRAFDVKHKRFAYQFDAKEAGDAMALGRNGECLVLFTRGGNGSHVMRMYDVRRKQSRADWTSELEPFTLSSDGEVNCARFSPDMIYLAVARNDDVTHLYDSRMVGKGVVHAFKHVGAARNIPGSESYGIVEAHWVETSASRLGLVTGGTDGCVRLWDIRKASEDPMNGTVIAETDFDIGYFSLGNPYNGEKLLVVGDSGGKVSIFDQGKVSPWTGIC